MEWRLLDRLSTAACAIPNTLSLGRMALALVFPAVGGYWRVGVLAVAAISDVLDGALSRRYQWSSAAGRWLDPLADKVFALAVVATFWFEGTLSWWQILLLAWRDIAVVAGTAVLLAARRESWRAMPSATWAGKLSTAALFLFFLSVLVLPPLFWPMFTLAAFLSGFAAVDYALLWFTHKAGKQTAAMPASSSPDHHAPTHEPTNNEMAAL